MDADEARQVLFAAAEVKMPKFEYGRDGQGETGITSKVSRLEEYMMETAIVRSDVERARLWMSEARHVLVKQWEEIVGWESFLIGGKRLKDATQADINRAKQQANRELWAGLTDSKHLIEQLARQARRLELDAEVASRAYTMVTGS